MKSIIITTFNRNHLLQYSLESIRRYSNDEIILVNDGEQPTEELAKRFGCYNIVTGNSTWRCPSKAINIGVEAASNDTIIITCAEIYHIDNIITFMVPGHREMVIPTGKDDTGAYLRNLQISGKHDALTFTSLRPLNTRLPFCMALHKKLFTDIGGYDEDFIGQGYDDTDFVTRLLDYGCSYREIPGRIVHLYHERAAATRTSRQLAYNKKLFELRRGIIVRNVK